MTESSTPAEEPRLPIHSTTAVFVNRWYRGDADAMGQLWVRFEPLVRYRIRHHSAWSLLENSLTLEDACQEVGARLAGSNPQSFTPSGKGSFVAWLSCLVDSSVTDLARRKGAAKRGDGKPSRHLDTRADREGQPLPGAAHNVGPSAAARIAEFEALVSSILTERELKAWTWVSIQGFTSEEAALGLSTTSGAVRNLLKRSRAKIEESLGASAATCFALARKRD